MLGDWPVTARRLPFWGVAKSAVDNEYEKLRMQAVGPSLSRQTQRIPIRSESRTRPYAKELGAADILVNAAGGNQDMVTVTDERCVEQILPDDWRSCFDLNLVGGALLPAKNLALP